MAYYGSLGATYAATPGGAMTQSIADRLCAGQSNKVILKPSRTGPGAAVYCTPTGKAVLYNNLDQWAMVPVKNGKSAIELCAPPYWGSGEARVRECMSSYQTSGAKTITSAERAKESYRQRQERTQEKLAQEVMATMPVVSTGPLGIPMKTWLVVGGIAAAAILLSAPKKGSGQ